MWNGKLSRQTLAGWLTEGMEADFDTFRRSARKAQRRPARREVQAIFKTYSLAASTNRDSCGLTTLTAKAGSRAKSKTFVETTTPKCSLEGARTKAEPDDFVKTTNPVQVEPRPESVICAATHASFGGDYVAVAVPPVSRKHAISSTVR
jgi:hypothetical protein